MPPEYDKPWVADGNLLPLNDWLFEDGPATDFTDRDLAHAMDLYDKEILYFDQEFGRLLERIRSNRLLERTIVILAADHGEEFLEHQHIFHCRDLAYDTVMRTPLLFWIPTVPGVIRDQGLVQNLDIVPTVLDYLEIDTSGDPLDGKSLRGLIEDNLPPHRYVFGLQRYVRSVTDGRYKLIYNIVNGETELFDLVRDPGERANIIARRPKAAERLTSVLMRWIDSAEGETDAAEWIEKGSEVTERLRALGYL